jgi:hypothetical protein
MAGQQESLSKFTLGAIASGLGFVATAINIVTALQGVSITTQALVLLGSIGVSALVLWSVKHFWIPKQDWEQTKACVRLGIHLSEIRTYIRELDLLNTIPTSHSNLATEIKHNELELLQETCELTEKLTDELKTKKTYEQCLKELKATESTITQLVDRAKSTIKEGGVKRE